jgi:hypothetical protein
MTDQQPYPTPRDPYAPVGDGQPPIYGRPAHAYVDPHDLPVEAAVEVPTWTCETPPSAFLMSLNGFDEIAIAANFGARIHDLREDPITGGRALVFVHQRRLGLTDPEAFKTCMGLTMKEVVAYFHPEPKKTDAASAEGNPQGAHL